MTQAGEITPSMEKQWQDEFRNCIAMNKHRREPYYVLTTCGWGRRYGVLKLNLAPMDFVPPMMLNTMLHKVDNKSGRIEEIWVLPFDDPDGVYDPSIPLGEVDEGLIKIAPHLPLIQN